MCRTRDSIHHPQDSLCALAGRGFPGIDWILVLDYCASIKWYPSRWQCGSTSLCWAAACVVCKLLTIYCETISQHALNQSHPSNSRRPAGPDGRTDGRTALQHGLVVSQAFWPAQLQSPRHIHAKSLRLVCLFIAGVCQVVQQGDGAEQ